MEGRLSTRTAFYFSILSPWKWICGIAGATLLTGCHPTISITTHEGIALLQQHAEYKMRVLVVITTEVSSDKPLTSCCLLNMKQFTGKVHDICEPFLNAVDKEVHQSLLAILRLCVYQLPIHTTTSLSAVTDISIIMITLTLWTMVMAPLLWQSHCKNSSWSADECRTAPSGCRLSSQANWRGQ